MKVALLLLAVCALGAASARYLTEPEYGVLFTNWARQHNKTYTTPDMFQYRYQVFKNNMDWIISYNAKNTTARMAMNRFGDLTKDEFATRNGYRAAPGRVREEKFIVTETSIPQTVDWRTKGAVNPVQNQEQCGSCWAFSACESTEAAWFFKSGQLILLSPQELVDCGSSTGNAGCEGGLMDDAFKWMIQNGGITSWSDLGYTGADGSCPSPLPPAVAKISSYADVPANNEAQLQAAIAQRPVSVAIEADQMVFQFYSSGVINDASCGTNLDHGVLAVGYNLSASPAYYIVKNSWGTDWGLSGYVYIAANVAPANQCGIASDPSYPIA